MYSVEEICLNFSYSYTDWNVQPTTQSLFILGLFLYYLEIKLELKISIWIQNNRIIHFIKINSSTQFKEEY